uniref:Uncharacterized protein n=1 Tax=Arion vulgaris TaxID=1028688 RepID=A0A0B6ZPG2_9EUPU
MCIHANHSCDLLVICIAFSAPHVPSPTHASSDGKFIQLQFNRITIQQVVIYCSMSIHDQSIHF